MCVQLFLGLNVKFKIRTGPKTERVDAPSNSNITVVFQVISEPATMNVIKVSAWNNI